MQKQKQIVFNNQNYQFTYFNCFKDFPELISLIECSKIIDNKIVPFGVAIYMSGYKMVKCIIEYHKYYNNPYINIDRDKKDFTEILNIAKKEILETNNKE